MSDRIVTILIASLAILLGVLILVTRFRSASLKKDADWNPAGAAARGETIVLAIAIIIAGIITLVKVVL